MNKKIKIKVIIPNASIEFRDQNIKERKNLASPGVFVDVDCLKGGPVSIECASDDAYAAPYILDAIRKAEKDGFDAITLDCAMDTSLRAAKETASIPLVSAGEASHLTAMLLGDRFSVITVLTETGLVIKENIKAREYQNRCASVRATDIAVLELSDEKKALKAILKESKIALDEDGASVIVLGCTGMSKIAFKIKKQLGIPVIDPAEAAIQMAENLVRMDLLHSKVDFPIPRKKEFI